MKNLKKIEKIYKYITHETENFDIEGLNEKKGFSAVEICEEMGCLRNNACMALNELFRQGKLIKIKCRPVLYIDKKCIERILDIRLQTGTLIIDSLDSLLLETGNGYKNKSPFDKLIGAKTSLKNQIEQAKAAILYPPNGLNTLIVGQTGVGKTLFANMMYNQAKCVKRLDKDASFVVFNCADYYNNPQLLISHLFGHIKGAYTGADFEKAGIVEKANGGILFLDEIHRLPPEGQEMLFYFMDTGKFNRLGETERNRKANVLIIGATTEDPSSALLKTFVRRIPISINIPSFENRTAKDKIDFVKFLFSNEARRVNKTIKIEDEAVKAIIGSTSYGNIGQMKSNIQLICANSFLRCINNKEYIEVDFKSLPMDIKNGLFYLSGKREEMEKISRYLDSQLIVTPEGHDLIIEDDPHDLPFNLYKIIEDKATILKNGGVEEEDINKFITTDINVHIKSFYNKMKNDDFGRTKILRIVDKELLEFSEEIMKMIEKRLKKDLSDRFLYALSLHLSSFLNRLRNNQNLEHKNIDAIINCKNKEFIIATDVKKMIEEKYDIVVPSVEVSYLTLLISSISEEQTNKHVAIIVAAHGNSTASSMVNVAKQLLGDSIIEAIDMPIEVSPTEILNEIIKKAKEIDMGKGVLLLVDMGSLAKFEAVITEKIDVKVKTLDMVTTALVLEAIRKATILDMDLENIYESLKDFRGYSNFEEKVENKINIKNSAIITICSSGEGTAVKLKDLIESVMTNNTKDKVKILPISVMDMDNKIKKIQQQYNIIAAVGVVKPKLNAPFISIEELIGGRGENTLINIIKSNNFSVQEMQESIFTKDLCEENLNQFLTYLNPSKIMGVLYKFVNEVESKTKTSFNNATRIRVMIHLGCALERMVINDGIDYKGDRKKLDNKKINIIKDASDIFKKALNISLTEQEVFYLSEMI